MGQAKRNRESGLTRKELRFLYLLRKITKQYNESQIVKFAKHRFK
jgi:hypothetical protein